MVVDVTTEISLIGHLMRRAGFGASAAELEKYAAKGYDATVDDLLTPERFPRLEEDLLERFHSEHADEESPQWTAMRWMYRMLNSERPLEEKMALMWHGIFATGYAKVTNNPMMRGQIEMLRDYGLGNLRDLLERLSRDPAMIYWLDQQMNHKEAVNENYGRELLELFSMGRGNYTEDDVKASARAFTGWTIDQTFPRYPTGYYESKFVYRPEDHDDSEKSFLGETGRFNGDDVIEIILRQPATARFVGRHIYSFFVSDDPDSEAIDTLAHAFVQSKYEMREVMRVLFHSDFFKNARFKKVKSPVEYVIGTVKLVGQHRDAYEFGLERLGRTTTLMGQELLNPPTVEGWHTGREWIDSSFLIERINFAVDRLGNLQAPGVSEMIDRMAADRSTLSASELLDSCLYELGGLELGEKTQRILFEELGIVGDVPCASVKERKRFESTVAQMLRLIAASREYQFA